MTTGLVLALALMTALAVAAVLWPLLRRPADPAAESFALDVYRDQLTEIERDLARGLIAAEEARAARTEIERRLLRAAAAAEQDRTGEPTGGRRPALVMLAALGVPLLTLGVYLDLGAPGLPDQPLAARQDRLQQEPGRPEIERMVAQLEARLATAPDDLEGWLMLGRSRSVLGDAPAAVEAYRRAQSLAGDDPRVLAGLGEALVANAGGVVTPEARNLFTRLTALQPDEPRAMFFLGWADAQAGDYHAALERWRGLLATLPADTPWRPNVEESVRTAARELGLEPEAVLAQIPPPPQQPGQADLDRIAAMSPDERNELIRSMVGTLAARLEADGSDVEGWRRLAQAYEALGEAGQVRATYEKALALHPDDPGLLKGYAASLAGPVRDDTGLPEVGDRAAELFDKVARLQPDDPEPWWFLGIRALQEGHKDTARAHWQRVLAHLDPAHPDYQFVKSRLDWLGS